MAIHSILVAIFVVIAMGIFDIIFWDSLFYSQFEEKRKW
jgi:hypothetical protein